MQCPSGVDANGRPEMVALPTRPVPSRMRVAVAMPERSPAHARIFPMSGVSARRMSSGLGVAGRPGSGLAAAPEAGWLARTVPVSDSRNARCAGGDSAGGLAADAPLRGLGRRARAVAARALGRGFGIAASLGGDFASGWFSLRPGVAASSAATRASGSAVAGPAVSRPATDGSSGRGEAPGFGGVAAASVVADDAGRATTGCSPPLTQPTAPTVIVTPATKPKVDASQALRPGFESGSAESRSAAFAEVTVAGAAVAGFSVAAVTGGAPGTSSELGPSPGCGSPSALEEAGASKPASLYASSPDWPPTSGSGEALSVGVVSAAQLLRSAGGGGRDEVRTNSAHASGISSTRPGGTCARGGSLAMVRSIIALEADAFLTLSPLRLGPTKTWPH